MATRPRWYKYAKNKDQKIPLKGIYGGNNVKFINDHATEIYRLVENKKNMIRVHIRECKHALYTNTHLIYDMWYLGAKLGNDTSTVFSLRESNLKYTHLYSDKKRDNDILIKLYEKTKNNLRRIY